MTKHCSDCEYWEETIHPLFGVCTKLTALLRTADGETSAPPRVHTARWDACVRWKEGELEDSNGQRNDVGR